MRKVPLEHKKLMFMFMIMLMLMILMLLVGTKLMGAFVWDQSGIRIIGIMRVSPFV